MAQIQAGGTVATELPASNYRRGSSRRRGGQWWCRDNTNCLTMMRSRSNANGRRVMVLLLRLMFMLGSRKVLRRNNNQRGRQTIVFELLLCKYKEKL